MVEMESVPTGDAAAMRPYARLLTGLVLGLLLFVSLVNYFVDPFGMMGRNQLGIFLSSEREQRQATANSWPHDAVFLGNSKLSMQNPELLKGFDWYNMSFSGARIEELVGMMEAYVVDDELVVLGLDLWMFNENYDLFPKKFKPYGWRTTAERYLVSYDALVASLQTIYYWWNDRTVMSLPGGYTNQELAAELERADPRRDFAGIYDYFRNTAAHNFSFSEWRLQLLREAKQKMEERGVEMLVFIHPQNKLMRDLLATEEFQPHWERFQREIRTLFPNVVDLSDSEYSEDRDFFLKDPVHYTPKVSTDFLNEAVIPQSKRYQARQD